MEKQKLLEVKVLMLISTQIFQECLDEIEGLLNSNNIFIESQRDEHE